MNIMRQTLLSVALTVIVAPPALAQLDLGGDMLDNCAKIAGLQEDEKYSEARAAARLCLEALDKKLEGAVGQYFLNDVAGWRRTSFEQNNAMGFAVTSASYKKDGTTANVSLTGGTGGGAGFGALSSLTSFGMMQTGRKVKVAGLPASVNPDGTIMVTLEDGSFLNFDSPDFNDADSALAGIGSVINEFPVADINQTLVDSAP